MEETSDNARVWRVYLDESDWIDNEMVNGWRGTLDTLLIFVRAANPTHNHIDIGLLGRSLLRCCSNLCHSNRPKPATASGRWQCADKYYSDRDASRDAQFASDACYRREHQCYPKLSLQPRNYIYPIVSRRLVKWSLDC